ncbi:MAG: hypothetical protein AAGD14_05545 [Planctomycetota bacterium]
MAASNTAPLPRILNVMRSRLGSWRKNDLVLRPKEVQLIGGVLVFGYSLLVREQAPTREELIEARMSAYVSHWLIGLRFGGRHAFQMAMQVEHFMGPDFAIYTDDEILAMLVGCTGDAVP